MADPPLFDPDVHTDPDVVVRLELACACGTVHQQVDPVHHCLPIVASFQAKHTGPGHGPVSAADALAEREARREAAMRSAGRQDEYKPRKRKNPPTGDAWDWAAVEVPK